MMNFITLAAGVMVGCLAASAAMLVLVFNKKVLRAYTKYILKISAEIENEVAEEMLSKEEAGL